MFEKFSVVSALRRNKVEISTYNFALAVKFKYKMKQLILPCGNE